jgi:L-ascorbate metabolism protein UlaG (beta-lactamase superfamily)
VYWTKLCQENSKFKVEAKVIGNGDKVKFGKVEILSVPAYNIVNKRPNGSPFHPKGEGNGYILSFGDKRVYVGGDTENIPEMKDFGKINIAFLPMNLPYTMTPDMVKDAAMMIKPNILYPYHFGKTDTNIIIELLKGNPEIDVRIRKME